MGDDDASIVQSVMRKKLRCRNQSTRLMIFSFYVFILGGQPIAFLCLVLELANPLFVAMVFGGVFLGIGLALTMLGHLGPLVCPKCNCGIFSNPNYCPRCGDSTAAIADKKWGFFSGILSFGACPSCNAEIEFYFPRRHPAGHGTPQFTIRHCMNCGTLLSEAGFSLDSMGVCNDPTLAPTGTTKEKIFSYFSLFSTRS